MMSVYIIRFRRILFIFDTTIIYINFTHQIFVLSHITSITEIFATITIGFAVIFKIKFSSDDELCQNMIEPSDNKPPDQS
ncbi:hypothetical protein F8M41_018990 [Gigaspora margarita]|uniref:Uncharacterized protein n=1 Tax=Gigaspora margarita TaxID=4874 RepID=A0A8H4EKT3_GIGMA|nr:hypothetical protein F8M41_018990 [Gigaspora margarita]